MLTYNASSVPILQLGLSGKGLSEAAAERLRREFHAHAAGHHSRRAIPYPYGGKQRQIMVDLDPALLQSKGLSPADVAERRRPTRI